MATDLHRKGVFTFMQEGATKVRKQLKQMSTGLDDLRKSTDEVTKSGKKSADGTKKELTPALGGLKAQIGGVVAGYFSLQAAAKAWQAAEQAARARNVADAFERLTASQALAASQMLSNMKAATRGTVAELDLMVQANQAAMLGLDLSRFDDMMEIARGASLATGQSMDFMLQSIVTGIGRQSKLILDNLGIVFNLERAYDRYADTLGKTADDLTEVERKQAFTNAAMEAGLANVRKMGVEGVSSAEQFDRMHTALADLKLQLADSLVGPLSQAAGLVADLAEGFGKLNEAWGLTGPTPQYQQQLDYEAEAQRLGLKYGGWRGPSAQEAVEAYRRKTGGGFAFPGEQGGIQAPPAFIRRQWEDTYLQKPEGAAPRIPMPTFEATPTQQTEDAFWSSMGLPTPSQQQAMLDAESQQWQGFFSGMSSQWLEDGDVNWKTYQESMTQHIRDTYGDSAEGMDIMRRFQEYLATEMPAAAEEGGLRTVAALKDVDYAVQGLGDAFAGLIMGNKNALKEGVKLIAAEAAARLKAVAAEASIEALWQTALGLGSLLWNPAKAAGHFKAAGAATLAATAAGVAAGTAARSFGAGAQFGLGGDATAYSRSGESAGAGSSVTGAAQRESVNVTRTAPTTVNVTIINNGPVYYGSEAHITAQALQEVLDTGEVITPEQEVA